MEREDLIRTMDARVASIQLDANEGSPWHSHSDVVETVFGLFGEVQIETRAGTHTIGPGQKLEVEPKVEHRVLNLADKPASYLLVQNGIYDYVPANP